MTSKKSIIMNDTTKNGHKISDMFRIEPRRLADITATVIAHLIEGEGNEDIRASYKFMNETFEGMELQYAWFQMGRMYGEKETIQNHNLFFIQGMLAYFKMKRNQDDKLKDHDAFIEYIVGTLTLSLDVGELEDSGEEIELDFSDIKKMEDTNGKQHTENPI
jgi:hypothetical protein